MTTHWWFPGSIGPWLLVGLLGTLVAGCNNGDALQVAAASSLRDVFPRIADRYERDHPGTHIELRFGGSQVLATQVEEGAGIDVFVSANPVQARRLVDGDLASNPTIVASNELVVAVPDDSPLTSIEDLAEPGLRIALGAPDVPVGALTELALALLDPAVADAIRGNVVTEDPNVSIVVSRLALGEADAVFVYRTDVALLDGVRAIPLGIPLPLNDYVAVIVEDADPAAADFVAYLLTDDVQAMLRAAGFLGAVARVDAR